MAIWTLICVLYILILPLLQCHLGQLVIAQSYRLFQLDVDRQKIDLACSCVVGLFTHLFLALLLKVIGLNWWIAGLVPLIPVALTVRDFPGIIAKFWPQPSFNFLAWFFVIVAIGLSVLGFDGDLYTAWSNNYGDAAFHIGMINSFIFGENFPPQYHIFAGETLSYPFLVNFWTALLWWPQPQLELLPFVFLAQWTTVWLLIYRFVSGANYFLLPWVILFGGGTYYLFGKYSYLSLNDGYPWVAFLGSIWIPQRTFLLGLVAVLFIIWLAYRGFTGKEDFFINAPRSQAGMRAAWIGLFSGITFLAHGHAALVTILFIGLACLITIVFQYVEHKNWSKISSKLVLLLLIAATAIISFACISPWLLAKTSMVDWMPGWLVSKQSTTAFDGIKLSAQMWFFNAGYCVVLLFPAIVFGKFIKETIAILLLFLLFNFIKLAHWDWDQIKLFITLFVIMITVWSFASEKYLWRLHFLTLILIIPGASEAFKTFQEGPRYSIYTKNVIAQAARIKMQTTPASIIAAAPDHNSLITLTGRKLYSGYPGTLWTHGLSQEREALQKNLPELVQCKKKRSSPDVICPDYIAWGQAEQKFWDKQNPSRLGLESVGAGLLFKLP